MDNLDQSQVSSPSVVFPIDPPLEKQSKVNLGRAIKLYFERNVPQSDIARIMGVSDQAIDQALKPYKQILFSKGEFDLLRKRKDDLLEGSFYRLLLDTSDPDKRDKASLNNTAYALKAVHEILRLETDQSTSNQQHIIGVDPGLRAALTGSSGKLSAPIEVITDPVGGADIQDTRDLIGSEVVQSLPDTDNQGMDTSDE